jgi:hypothetical protein
MVHVDPEIREEQMKIADELERLTKLRDAGSLSDEEFARAKQTLLNAPTPSMAAPTPTHTESRIPRIPTAPTKPSLIKAADLVWLPVALLALPFGVIGFLVSVAKRQARFQKFSQHPESYRPIPAITSIRPIGVFVALCLLAPAIFLWFVYIPEHTFNEHNLMGGTARALDGTLLSSEGSSTLRLLAGALGLLGIFQLLTGAVSRAERVKPCPICEIDVVAKRAFIGERCERCDAAL